MVKYMPQLQHNMWVIAARSAVLSVITGGGKWVEITTHADPLYQHLIVTAERKFWRCVESGEPPALFGIDPPKPRIETVRIVDMSASNAWAGFGRKRATPAKDGPGRTRGRLPPQYSLSSRDRYRIPRIVNLLFTIVGAKHSKSSKVAKCLGDPNQVNDAAAVSEARQTRARR